MQYNLMQSFYNIIGIYHFVLVGFIVFAPLILTAMIVFILVQSYTEETMARAHEEDQAKLHEEIDRLEIENRELWRLCYSGINVV